MGSDDSATGGAGESRLTIGDPTLKVALTPGQLDLLIHAAANGMAMLDSIEKDRMREIIQDLKGVLDGSA